MMLLDGSLGIAFSQVSQSPKKTRKIKLSIAHICLKKRKTIASLLKGNLQSKIQD